jgi:isopenicillin-N epimerase
MTDLAQHWTLDPEVVFLNHGSFGACPTPILEYQSELRTRMEREPMRFFLTDLPGLLEDALEQTGRFLGADTTGLTFVNNATTGVNTVLRSLSFYPGDKLLVTDHAYPACRNALDFVAARSGLTVVVAKVPFPTSGPDEVFDAVMAACVPGLKLALLDHITSPTGLLFPMERLVPALQDQGVDVLIDGAHAPGMIELNLDQLGAAYYTGNFHKWLCTPKGAGFLHVRADRVDAIRPLTISHGASAPTATTSRFRNEFDWTGTEDPTPWLSVPASIRFFRELLPGGWKEMRTRNQALLLAARNEILQTTGLEAPCPDAMLRNLATFILPYDPGTEPKDSLGLNPLRARLLEDHRIQVPVFAWPTESGRMLRISAQLYNKIEQYRILAAALRDLLAEEEATA